MHPEACPVLLVGELVQGVGTGGQHGVTLDTQVTLLTHKNHRQEGTPRNFAC